MPRLSNEQHETFARMYVNGVAGRRKYHGGHAAVAAGYEPTHCSKLMARPEVLARIQELNDAMLTNADITAQRVMLELGRVAFADVRKVYAADGSLLPVCELDDDTAAVVSAFKHEQTSTRSKEKVMNLDTGEMEEVETVQRVRTTEVKRYDKTPALGILAKHFKLVGDEGDGVNALASALADRLQTARKRNKQEQAT
jgi:phage terminase small subunit